MQDPVFVIAEAGINHNGDLNTALAMVEVAAHAGADAVKFQTFSVERLATAWAGLASYQGNPSRQVSTQHELLRSLELSRTAHEELMAASARHGIMFLSTAFDPESLLMLVDLGVPMLKIPSGEITNLPLLRLIGGLKRPTLLSTGMATLPEVAAALESLERAGTPRELVTVLHCTSSYPTEMDDVNLRAMLTIRDSLGVRVGYSDHTLGSDVAIAATALGAVAIEKHFTLNRAMPGPDHAASLEPNELSAMIRSIRNTTIALGSALKSPTDQELETRLVARKSLVTTAPIKARTLFTEANVAAKRPGSGLSPMEWDNVVGSPALRDYDADELIDS